MNRRRVSRLAVSGLLSLALLGLPATAFAQDGDSLDWLIGRWTGSGTSMGQPSKAVFEARPALGGKFVEFRYRLAKPSDFEGRAFYKRAGDGAWEARWFDSQGDAFPITAQLAAKALTADWGVPGTERGRTVYRLLDDGRLEIVDSMFGPDGKPTPFGRQTFRRAE